MFESKDDGKIPNSNPIQQSPKKINNGHHNYKRNKFSLSLDDLQKFLDYYIKRYNNFYSKRFKKLDLRKGWVENKQIYQILRNKIVSKGQIPHIVYEIFDVKTRWIRVGRSKNSPKVRYRFYTSRALSYDFTKGMGNIYPKMALCKTKKKILKRFKIRVSYVLPSKGEAQIIEEFLIIFRNRADNHIGYDLTINNEYNKIVGDIYKIGSGGNFLSGALNTNYKDVPPIALANAVLRGLKLKELTKKFDVCSKTIRRRFNAYGYGIRGTYNLTDARAYLVMPYFIEGFKRGLNQDKFFKFCTDEGIKIFNRYRFVLNKGDPRGCFFRSMLKQIWGTSKHKEARFQVIADYIISSINRPDITSKEIASELSNIVDFKYDREFDRICRQVFGMSFTKKRDEIYKPLVEKLALYNKNERKILLKIAVGLGLCSETDSIFIKTKSSGWVREYIHKNYGTTGRGLVNKVTCDSFVYKSLKQRVFEYMEKYPIARPNDLMIKFADEEIEIIRSYVNEWKNNNNKKVCL